MTESSHSPFQLTEDQKTAIGQIQAFLAQPGPGVFLLKGYAGTGKTFLIRELTNSLKQQGRIVRLAAPTGRAAMILGSKLNHSARTIHSLIYRLDELEERDDKVDTTTVDEGYKMRFGIRRNEDPFDTIYVLDEASMISNVYSDQEFLVFGSGHLLEDIMSYTLNSHCRRKIIFVGDPAQLPPVGDPCSPALDISHLSGFIPEESIQEYEMTQVVRQREDSGILSHSFQLREGIRNQSYITLNLHDQFPDVHHFDLPTQLSQQVSAGITRDGIEENIVITYSNKDASEANKILRGHYFPGQEQAVRGDRILVNQNNQLYEIYNGEFGHLLFVGERITRSIPLKRKEADGVVSVDSVSLSWSECVVKIKRSQGNYEVKGFFLENLMYSDNRDVTREEQIALYLDVVFRASRKGIKKKTPEFREFLRSDPFFNCLKIKFGYAVTCHKSQGGEWKNVWVWFDQYRSQGGGQRNEPFFRWAYTAITRATGKLCLYQPPLFSPFSNIPWKEVDLGDREVISDSTVYVEVSEEDKRLLSRFQLSEAAHFLQAHFLSVYRACESNEIVITARNGFPFRERYSFVKDGQLTSIDWGYNGKEEIKPGQAKGNGPASLDLAATILQAVSSQPSLIIDPGSTTDLAGIQVASFTNERLEEFYSRVSALASQIGITVAKLEHHNHAEHYSFSRGIELAKVIFRYRTSRGLTFSSAEPIKAHCNSARLLLDLQNLVSSLSDS